MEMENVKFYIWVSTTIIVAVTFLATGHWLLAFLSLVVSYVIWSVTV